MTESECLAKRFNNTRGRFLAPALIAASLALSGCGSGGDSASPAAPAVAAATTVPFQILWTNDTHGYFVPTYHAEYTDLDSYATTAATEGTIGGYARIAAMVNNDIQGASLTIPHAAVAVQAGLKILMRTGDYIQRAGGTIWCMQSFVEQHPDTVKKIIRAIAKSVMYFRTNKEGSIKVLEHHLGIKTDAEAGIIWDQLHDVYGAEVPKDLFRKIFESRRLTMIAARQWSQDKPLPDPEQFLARTLLESTLKEMGYVPTNLAAPTKTN